MFLPHSVSPPQSCKSVSQLCDLIYLCLYISIFISSINMSLPTPFVKAKFADNSWLGLPKDTDLQRQATIKCFWAASSNLSRNSFKRVFLNAQCKMDHDGFPLHSVLDSHLKLNKTSEKWSNFVSNLMDPNLDGPSVFQTPQLRVPAVFSVKASYPSHFGVSTFLTSFAPSEESPPPPCKERMSEFGATLRTLPSNKQ